MTPEEACDYAKKYGPSKETRKAACEDPAYAFWYAKEHGPSKDTRNAACQNPHFAYWYAVNIEKGFHEVIWNSVKNTKYEEKYIEFLNSLMKEEII